MPSALVMPSAMAICTPSATSTSRHPISAAAALMSNTRLGARTRQVEPGHDEVVDDGERAAREDDEAGRPGRHVQRALALELAADPRGDGEVPPAPDDQREEQRAKQV